MSQPMTRTSAEGTGSPDARHDPVPGRHRAHPVPPHRRLRAGLLWPLAALVVAGLVTARPLRGTPLPDDGGLAVPAFGLLRGESDLSLLAPGGLGAVHAAVYAAVTRAFQRHATLAGAERELLLVVLLLSAVLLWGTARRLDLPDAACAVAVLALGGLPGLAGLHAAATPAVFAVGWLLVAGRLVTSAAAGARPTAVVRVLAALATGLAVLLAPDALLLLVPGALAAGTVPAGRAPRWAARAVAGLVLLVGARVLVQRWDPQPGDPARWGGDPAGLVLLTVALVVVGGLAAWRLPRFRAAGTALTGTAVLAVGPPSGRLPALLLCLPLGALLLGALAAAATEAVSRPVLQRRPRALLAAGAVAALFLAARGAAAAADLVGGHPVDVGPSGAGQLVAWTVAELPDGAVLTAAPRLTAELVHAGADPARVQSGAVVPVTGQVLEVTTTGRPPSDGRVLARFGGLTVVDPRPARPTGEQIAARRNLAAALLANPTTEVSAADAEVMAAGQVDPRLLTLLAGISARYGLGPLSLPPVPGESADVVRRQAVLAPAGRGAPAGEPNTAERLRAWLDAQQQPYAPDRVTDVEDGLLIGYRLVPDPDGLVRGPGGR